MTEGVIQWGTKPVSDVTVVITNYQRPEMLWTAYQSCKSAKVQHIVISSSGANDAVDAIHKKISKDNPSVTITSRKDDAGCNECWMRGVALTKTGYTTILHDDDFLLPEYERIVSGLIKSDFIHWDGNKHGPKGKIEGSYITRPDLPTGQHPATFLLSHLLIPAVYTLSPVSGCFPTDHILKTLEECEKNFGSWAYLRPTMMVGNDLLLWLRACEKFHNCYYSHTPMVSYGHWDGSASYDDCVNDRLKLLPIYKAARSYFLNSCPKIVHAVPRYVPMEKKTIDRIQNAASSWDVGYERGLVWPNHQWTWHRDSTSIHERKQTPFLKDVLKKAMECSTGNDMIAFTNDDTLVNVFFWFDAWHWLKTHGAGCAFRRCINSSQEFQAFNYILKPHGEVSPGRDAFFFTQEWLREHMDEIPDYVLGFGGWDSTLAMLIRLSAGNTPKLSEFVEEHRSSEIGTRHIYHVSHDPDWIHSKHMPGNVHNRALTDKFFKERLGWEMPKYRGDW